MPNLQGRVALITGAGGGIGAATARRLAQLGASVALNGRRPAPLEALATQIRTAGGRCGVVVGDIAAEGAAGRVVQATVDQLGALDVLVNNAALYEPGPALQTSPGTWRKNLEVNVTAPFLLCCAAHDHLRAASGVIVNVLSNLAQRPVANTAAYSASKAALLSLTQALALEWARDGIRVVGVAAGIVDTPMHGDRTRLAQAGGLHPLGRVGQPEEVAEVIAFLAGAQSAWTTGAVWNVDGGIGLV
jgi:NAD(P)-dependent dehydrogenase (short-subunit alcohol dehydrogenase family)